jgi:hypothetical protein
MAILEQCKSSIESFTAIKTKKSTMEEYPASNLRALVETPLEKETVLQAHSVGKAQRIQ